MSVESAVAYIRRMREDAQFRKHLNENSENEAANWAYVKEQGYDFSLSEFKQAQDVIYKEYGVDPSAGF
jgi:predicted ribosomally synthesized peptide with nif11-like leader